MTDPAIEAAQRARAADIGHTGMRLLIDAAREALTPLRNLHRPVTRYAHPDAGRECLTCHTAWPCDTAKLIYPEGEL